MFACGFPIYPCFTAHIKVSIVAVKFIPYFTGSSEKVVIAISLARIYVNNVAPISVYACLVHSDKLHTYSNAYAQHVYM